MNRGVSLIEVILVLAVIAALSVIMVATLDPASLLGRGRDAQRKKDVGRIKTAFEEYYNDKECYPTQQMIDNLECGTTDFKLWLNKWPCDPLGKKYRIGVGPSGSNCPNTYVILTNLEYKKDASIPTGWYTWLSSNPSWLVGGIATTSEVNYGVSSSNTNWYEITAPPQCSTPFKQCYRSSGNGCTSLAKGQTYANAYTHQDCLPECLVSCCQDGELCQ